jgi:hypothetical protein
MCAAVNTFTSINATNNSAERRSHAPADNFADKTTRQKAVLVQEALDWYKRATKP